MLHAGGDAGENFVGNRAHSIAEDGDGQVVAKDGDTVTHAAGDVGYVNHADIHTDIAHVVSSLAVDQAVAVAVAQVAAQAVGIANGDGGNARGALKDGATAVADGVTSGYVTYLQDGSLQRGHIVKHGIVAWIDAIEAQSQAHHVELVLGKVFNTSGIADMAQNLMVVGCLQLATGSIKKGKLMVREVVEAVGVAAHEVAEHGAGHEGRLPTQTLDELGHVGGGVEAQAVHPRVELDVDGEIGDAVFLSSVDECFEDVEREDFRLQTVVEKHLEGRHLGVHNHDVGRDASLAQVSTLVGPQPGNRHRRPAASCWSRRSPCRRPMP